jgi:hypothetical protein
MRSREDDDAFVVSGQGEIGSLPPSECLQIESLASSSSSSSGGCPHHARRERVERDHGLPHFTSMSWRNVDSGWMIVNVDVNAEVPDDLRRSRRRRSGEGCLFCGITASSSSVLRGPNQTAVRRRRILRAASHLRRRRRVLRAGRHLRRAAAARHPA